MGVKFSDIDSADKSILILGKGKKYRKVFFDLPALQCEGETPCPADEAPRCCGSKGDSWGLRARPENLNSRKAFSRPLGKKGPRNSAPVYITADQVTVRESQKT